jgi:hypothetical protein
VGSDQKLHLLLLKSILFFWYVCIASFGELTHANLFFLEPELPPELLEGCFRLSDIRLQSFLLVLPCNY